MKCTVYAGDTIEKKSQKGNQYWEQTRYYELKSGRPAEKVVERVFRREELFPEGDSEIDFDFEVRNNALTALPVLQASKVKVVAK